MKKINLIISLSIVTNVSFGQALYVNGATLKISSGASLKVNGNLNNQSTSNYINDGNVVVTGLVTNNQILLSPATGTLSFNGTTRQTVSGSATLFAKDVEINNAAGVELTTPLKIDGECKFISGIVSAKSATTPVIFTSNGIVSSINVPNNTSHVLGYVVKEGTGSFTYPVGDSLRYQGVGTNLATNSAGMQVVYDTSDAGTAPFTTGGTEATALLAYNAKEFWNITALGTASGTVTIFWDNYRNGGIASATDLKVAHKSGGNWLNEGTTGTGTAASGSVTSNTLSTWSPFGLGSISAASPLPLNWISVNASMNKLKQAEIRWKVQEHNVARYEILKSNNGTDFSVLANINTKGSGMNDYIFIDNNPLQGTSFYRIKQVEINGQHSFSNTLKITNQQMSIISVSPNPATNILIVNIDNNELINTPIRLLDVTGKLVQTTMINSSLLNIDISQVCNGNYLLQFNDGQTIKVVKE